ncbi:MAG: NAD-dependent epimerase/dehydratase family protein, partial [Rhodospirillales bacterium]|nr:NAD-dependent epimerase/dehydratase family protein [Rhodospirillales bacterium]
TADFTTNVVPVLNLAEAIRAMPKKVDVLYSGTASVAGMAKALPVDPNTAAQPVTVYDQHKLMAEQYLELYARMGDLRAVTLRLANVYGPGLTVGSPDRGILNKVIAAALSGKPVSIFGEGDSTRDYIYIDDVIEAFVAAGAHMGELTGKHYFLGSGTGHLVKDAFTLAATQAAAARGITADISYVPWSEGLSEIERRNFVADIKDLSTSTGWSPKVDLYEGITRTIAAFVASEEA